MKTDFYLRQVLSKQSKRSFSMAKEKAKQKARPIQIAEDVPVSETVKKIEEEKNSDVVDGVKLKELQAKGVLVGCTFSHSVEGKVFYKVKCK